MVKISIHDSQLRDLFAEFENHLKEIQDSVERDSPDIDQCESEIGQMLQEIQIQ
jgi:hypothetical protein